MTNFETTPDDQPYDDQEDLRYKLKVDDIVLHHTFACTVIRLVGSEEGIVACDLKHINEKGRMTIFDNVPLREITSIF